MTETFHCPECSGFAVIDGYKRGDSVHCQNNHVWIPDSIDELIAHQKRAEQYFLEQAAGSQDGEDLFLAEACHHTQAALQSLREERDTLLRRLSTESVVRDTLQAEIEALHREVERLNALERDWPKFVRNRMQGEPPNQVKQCPGCKMAIYDQAAIDGWCTNCNPEKPHG